MDLILREADVMCVALRFSNPSALTRLQAALKAQGVEADWTEKERLHCTLLTADIADDQTARSVLSGLSLPVVFALEGTGIEVWGDEYLVLTLDPRPALPRLQTDIFNRATALGLNPGLYAPPGVYRPHVTLGTVSGLSAMPDAACERLYADEVVVWNGDYRQVGAGRLPAKAGDRFFIEVSGLSRRLVARGGPGSGHFGHEGRPGKVGGSLPGDFHSAESGEAIAGRPAASIAGLKAIDYSDAQLNAIYQGLKAYLADYYPGYTETDSVGVVFEQTKKTRDSSWWLMPNGKWIGGYGLDHERSSKTTMRNAVGNEPSLLKVIPTKELREQFDDNGNAKVQVYNLAETPCLGMMHEAGYLRVNITAEGVGDVIGRRRATRAQADALESVTSLFPKFDMLLDVAFSPSFGGDPYFPRGDDPFAGPPIAGLGLSKLFPQGIISRGGPGSGHFGHEGRPGKVGGSQPSDFHSAEAPLLAKAPETYSREDAKRVADALASGPFAHIHELAPGATFSGFISPDGRAIAVRPTVGFDPSTDTHATAAARALDNAGLGIFGTPHDNVQMFLGPMRKMGFVRVATFKSGQVNVDFWRPVPRAAGKTLADYVDSLPDHEVHYDVDFDREDESGNVPARWTSGMGAEEMFKLAGVQRGGPGSGHFGHEGRPGKVGGSQPSDFHSGEGKGLALDYSLFPKVTTRNGQKGFAKKVQALFDSSQEFRLLVKAAWVYSTGGYEYLIKAAQWMMEGKPGKWLDDERKRRREQNSAVRDPYALGMFERTTHVLLEPEYGKQGEPGAKWVSITGNDLQRGAELLVQAIAESPDTDEPIYRGIQLEKTAALDMLRHGTVEGIMQEKLKEYDKSRPMQGNWENNREKFEEYLRMAWLGEGEASIEGQTHAEAWDTIANRRRRETANLMTVGNSITLPLISFSHDERVAKTFSVGKGGGGGGLDVQDVAAVLRIDGKHNGFNISALSGWPQQAETVLAGTFRVKSVSEDYDFNKDRRTIIIALEQESTYAPVK